MKELLDAVKTKKERIAITRYGKVAAYLVPMEDGEALELSHTHAEGGRGKSRLRRM